MLIPEVELRSFFYSLLLLVVAFTAAVPSAISAGDDSSGGRWKVVLNSTGVVGMHMALTHDNTVVMFDQIGTVQSGYPLRHRSDGTPCQGTGRDLRDWSCYAHSVEYDIASNNIRPLRVETDPWCSSGSFLSNGTLLQLGGFEDGTKRIRYFSPCDSHDCDWTQARQSLSDNRWYASTLILPDTDQVIVVGGRRVFSFEFFPRFQIEGSHDLPFLRNNALETNGVLGNYYPFLHLSSDGNLFIMADRDSILFNYERRRVVTTFPRMPGGGSRTHPYTGSSIILPLDHGNDFERVEVMVCGGAAVEAERKARHGSYLPGMRTCGRMEISGVEPEWHMESMPGPRLMNDMIILPTGNVLIINGAKNGAAGFNKARDASLQPYLYEPNEPSDKRFSLLRSTRIARMYHSSAILLPDGSILVAGSNPNNRYAYSDVSYPTELRLQTYMPPYLHSRFDSYRPENISVRYDTNIDPTAATYTGRFYIQFWIGRRLSDKVEFTAYAPPFTTHSVSMNQRMLRLRCTDLVRREDGWVNAVLEAPPSPNVAPPGYYLLTVVNSGIPSESRWIRFIRPSLVVSSTS